VCCVDPRLGARSVDGPADGAVAEHAVVREVPHVHLRGQSHLRQVLDAVAAVCRQRCVGLPQSSSLFSLLLSLLRRDGVVFVRCCARLSRLGVAVALAMPVATPCACAVQAVCLCVWVPACLSICLTVLCDVLCVAAGYPVPPAQRVSCTNCGSVAHKQHWNAFVVKSKTCPWCHAAQSPVF
jgi:hypothetical protein